MTTLQEVLERQQGLNSLLDLHLNDLEKTIITITGKDPEPKINFEGLSGGILEDINSVQKDLENKIDTLNILKQQLNKSVYKPIEENLAKGQTTKPYIA